MSNTSAQFMKCPPVATPCCLSAQSLHAVDTWRIALPDWRAYSIVLSGELRLSSPAFLQFDGGLSACISFSSKDSTGFQPFVERVPLHEECHAGQGRLLLYIQMNGIHNSVAGTMKTQYVHTGLPEEAVAFQSVAFTLRENGYSYLALQTEQEAGILPGSHILLWGQGGENDESA